MKQYCDERCPLDWENALMVGGREKYVIKLKRCDPKEDKYIIWNRQNFKETPYIDNATTFDLEELNEVRIALNYYALAALEWFTYDVEEVKK